VTPERRAELLRIWQAELAAAFCVRVCVCGSPAVSVAPGAEPVREAGITLRAAVADRNFCLDHAMPIRRAA